MKDICVVNVSVATSFSSLWYPYGQDRMIASINQFHSDIDFMYWKHMYPPDCPTHQEVPYAFKVYAIDSARKVGYKYIIWLDSAVVAHRPLTPMIDYIKEKGHYLQNNGGWNTGQWSTDACLNKLGVTREEAFNMPHLMACIMGFDVTNSRTNLFIDKELECAKDGITFLGPWNNNDKSCSKDEKVLGHKHDQTVASILSIQLGMEWIPWEDSMLIYGPHIKPEKESVIFTAQGGDNQSRT